MQTGHPNKDMVLAGAPLQGHDIPQAPRFPLTARSHLKAQASQTTAN